MNEELFTVINKAVNNNHGNYPWLDTKTITEEYGDNVLLEINRIMEYMWDSAIQFGNDQSVVEFGKHCRESAREKYHLLDEETIEILAVSNEYNYYK